MMPSGKRRPGQQITKDDYEDDEDGPVSLKAEAQRYAAVGATDSTSKQPAF